MTAARTPRIRPRSSGGGRTRAVAGVRFAAELKKEFPPQGGNSFWEAASEVASLGYSASALVWLPCSSPLRRLSSVQLDRGGFPPSRSLGLTPPLLLRLEF